MENVRGAGGGKMWPLPIGRRHSASTCAVGQLHLPTLFICNIPPKIIVWFNCKMEQTIVGRQHGGAWVGIETEETLAKSASRYDTKETYSPFVDISIFCFVNLSLKYSWLLVGAEGQAKRHKWKEMWQRTSISLYFFDKWLQISYISYIKECLRARSGGLSQQLAAAQLRSQAFRKYSMWWVF